MSDRQGWIPAYRKLFNPGHVLARRDPACRRFAWLDLVQMAQHKPRKVRGVQLKRGELLASVRYLEQRWRWSRSKVQRDIKRFISETLIEPLSETPSGTVYRIVNYERYSVFNNDKWDTKRDTKRAESGTPTDTNTNITNNHYEQSLIPIYSPGFENDVEELLSTSPPVSTPGRERSDEELAMIADEVLGLGKLKKNEKSLNRMVVREWRYQSNGRSDTDIESAIHGLRLMIEQRRPEVERYKPDQGYSLAVLRMKDKDSGQRRETQTLYEQGDGKALRVLFDVAQEAWVSNTQTYQVDTKTYDGLKKLGADIEVHA